MKESRKVATHPKCADMIMNAVETLKEGKGSSKRMIFKHIVQNDKLRDNLNAVSSATSAADS